MSDPETQTPSETDLQPDAVLRYADRDDATIDVFVPEGVTRMAVFLIHGGFWRQAYDATGVRPLARALAREGFLVAAPEYRRVGHGGGWPTTCEDVEEAYVALPRLLGDLDKHPRGVLICGHSAGGHLTLWLAARQHTSVGAVALAPVADLRDAVATRMGDGAAIEFLGGEGPVDAADPARLMDSQRPSYPVTILHGTADEPVPVANSRLLVERHPWVELRELPDVDHMAMIDPASSVYPELLRALGDPSGV